MKFRILILLLIIVFPFLKSIAQLPVNYYTTTQGLSGDSLKAELNNIISGHVVFPYTSSSQMDCWDVLKQADKDPNNSNNVVGLYSRFSMNGPLEYNNAQGWSREHVWAKSRGNFGTLTTEGTDLHNLFAEDVSTNSARNNRNFDLGDTRYIDNSGVYNGSTDAFTSVSRWVWEPPDSLKGDVARVIFYMDVRYEGENGELDLEVVDSLLSNSDQSPLHGNARILYSWHLMDSVSNSERRRNDTIYKYQRNRNPFVDHPSYVQSIYGARYGNLSVGVRETMKNGSVRIYPNPASDYLLIAAAKGTVAEVVLYNQFGEIISKRKYNEATITMDVSKFERGFYLIKISNSYGEGKILRQFFK